MCDRWYGENGFEHFLEDMGERPIGKTLDRYPDKKGNYEPGNCRWATKIQQMRNKSDNLNFTVGEITACLAELCERFHLPYPRVYKRLKLGWSIERALGIMGSASTSA
jgi:hypothetical protein